MKLEIHDYICKIGEWGAMVVGIYKKPWTTTQFMYQVGFFNLRGNDWSPNEAYRRYFKEYPTEEQALNYMIKLKEQWNNGDIK